MPNKLTVYHSRSERVKSWLEARWLSVKDTTRIVFIEADVLTIRTLLAFASLLSALSLMIEPDKFLRPSYELVAKFGTEWMWAIYFILHAAGITWRIYERSVSRPKWALLINAWGFSIWFVSTVSMSIVAGVGIPLSLSITMCAASGWALYRTGLRKDVVSM